MTATLQRGEWSAARPGRTLPPGKIRYPIYRRLGGLQGRFGRAENLVPNGIRSRTSIAQSLYRLSYPAHFPIYYSLCFYNYTDWFFQNSAVRIAILYEIFHTCTDGPRRRPSLLHKGNGALSGGKDAGAWRWLTALHQAPRLKKGRAIPLSSSVTL